MTWSITAFSNFQITTFSHFHILNNIEQGTRNDEFRSKGRSQNELIHFHTSIFPHPPIFTSSNILWHPRDKHFTNKSAPFIYWLKSIAPCSKINYCSSTLFSLIYKQHASAAFFMPGIFERKKCSFNFLHARKIYTMIFRYSKMLKYWSKVSL